MNKRILETMVILLLSLLMPEALAYKALDDQQLNAITAGNASMEYDSSLALARIPLHYSRRNIEVDGDLLVMPAGSYTNTPSLQLLDNAQSELRSLININAVDSPVNVLLNLNINVNSTIDKIIQLNSLRPE